MKKAVKYSLFAAAGCIILGIAIMLIAFFTGSYRGQNRSFIKKIIDADPRQYSSVAISECDKDIIVKPSSDNKIHITYYTDGNDYRVSTDGNELEVTCFGTNHFFGINFNFKDDSPPATVVELPEKLEASLSLSSTSGDINLSSIDAEMLNLGTTSGEITVSGSSSTGSLSISSTSGNLFCSSVSAETMTYSTVSGEINLDNCSTEDTVYIGSTSGDISAVNFSAQLLSVNTTSGELELDSSAVESLLCETTSGDIDFEHLRSKNIVLSTTSGEIEGSIVGNQAEYDISWSSVSGNCNLPKTSSGNICSLTVDTTSGDCYIVFES